jgi:hypothetical protein
MLLCKQQDPTDSAMGVARMPLHELTWKSLLLNDQAVQRKNCSSMSSVTWRQVWSHAALHLSSMAFKTKQSSMMFKMTWKSQLLNDEQRDALSQHGTSRNCSMINQRNVRTAHR